VLNVRTDPLGGCRRRRGDAAGQPDPAAVRSVPAATTKPLNVMVGIKGKSFTVAALAEAGLKRISVATSLFSWRPTCRGSARCR
jgi:hypothetical protein